eukprot:gnl/Chilomastix_cuspidata/5934.p2 GENE.gnl/Chilomastix_cuspidata/5934~~gnl/Chilomastix_cuspidata/5934.p2  ORF type:complete len:141 (+),score=36.21 gnl/Chilomastix_cuspidata/5934:224-646(+)
MWLRSFFRVSKRRAQNWRERARYQARARGDAAREHLHEDVDVHEVLGRAQAEPVALAQVRHVLAARPQRGRVRAQEARARELARDALELGLLERGGELEAMRLAKKRFDFRRFVVYDSVLPSHAGNAVNKRFALIADMSP